MGEKKNLVTVSEMYLFTPFPLSSLSLSLVELLLFKPLQPSQIDSSERDSRP